MINVHVDAKDALDYVQRLSSQMPYATSLALNRVANRGQDAARAGMQRTFTLRRPQFLLNTVKINREDRATKTKLDVTVRIDPQRDILAKFEAGGTKTPRDGRNIAIPTNHVRRTKTDIVTKGQRPRILLDSKSAASGRIFKTAAGIFQRIGTKAASTVRMLYLFRPAVRLRPQLNFVTNVTTAVRLHWVDEMVKAFTDAERTARR